MIKLIKNFRQDESGATAIEYGLIAALVSVAAIGALGSLGDSLLADDGSRVWTNEKATARKAARSPGLSREETFSSSRRSWRYRRRLP